MAKYQQKPAWCGPAAIQNSLRAYGIRIGQERIAKLAGTCLNDGTDENGIIRAVEDLGYVASPFGTDHKKEAADWLLNNMVHGYPCVICVNNWGHWVAVVGRINRRVWLVDSTREPFNQAENGVHCLTVNTVVRRWRASRRMAEKEPKWYGISIQIPSAAKKS